MTLALYIIFISVYNHGSIIMRIAYTSKRWKDLEPKKTSSDTQMNKNIYVDKRRVGHRVPSLMNLGGGLKLMLVYTCNA